MAGGAITAITATGVAGNLNTAQADGSCR
jgi:hypothetical protein